LFNFKNTKPEKEGVSSGELLNLIRYSNSLSNKNGLLVMRNNKVVIEHYQSANEETKWDIQSTTKSFGAAIFVQALDSGMVKLNDRVCNRTDMTVHQLASMTAGFPKPHNISCDSSLLFSPGADFAYSDGGTNILRDVLMHALKIKDIKRYLSEQVLDPIGAFNWTWDGRFSAGLSITIRDMARYGRLWLCKGEWNGKRIFSEKNAKIATRATNPKIMKSYGYLWWANSHGTPKTYERYGFKLNPVFGSKVPADAFMSIGASRTFILIIPSLDIVVVRSGSGFHSIQSGDTKLTDESRHFTDKVLSAIIA